MTTFIVLLFTVLLTMAIRMGDLFAMLLCLAGFLVMFIFAEELESRENT
jgi:hypothetical protein